MSDAEKLDRILANIATLAERVAVVETMLLHYQQAVTKASDAHDEHERRIDLLAIDQAAVRQRVGFVGGLAGLGALVWNLLRFAVGS